MLRKVKSQVTSHKSQVIKDLLLCLLSAVLLILSFPNFNIWPFAWFGFVPIFFSLKDKSLKETFFLFFITGIIFWSGVIYWLVHVTLPGTIVLVVYLALYFAIFGLIIRPCIRKSRPYALIFIPSVWVLLEFIRGYMFTGFPWALLGYSQYLNLPVIQIADITGAWGVSFFIMLVNVAIVEIIWSVRNSFWLRLRLILAVLILFLILIFGYGYYRLSPHAIRLPAGRQGNTRYAIHISVIQGNIPQQLKWEEEYSGYILDKYSILTLLAAESKPDLVIWPEAAVPGILGENNWVFEKTFSLVRKIEVPLLTGAVVEDKGLYYGSALLIDKNGKLAGRYDKLHLVPFGEFIPLKKILPFLQTIVPIGDIERGKEYTIFQVASRLPAGRQARAQVTSKFAVLDCFEDVFPELAREFTKRGADFLVNITNDAWYRETPASYQHLQASVFRAVENRRYLARAANTGVSGFIAPTGRIISLVQDGSGKAIFINGYKTEELLISSGVLSFYTRYGNIFLAACFLITLYGIIRRL